MVSFTLLLCRFTLGEVAALVRYEITRYDLTLLPEESWNDGIVQLAQGGKQISPTPGLVTDLLTTHVLIKNVCAGMYHNVALSVDDEVRFTNTLT